MGTAHVIKLPLSLKSTWEILLEPSFTAMVKNVLRNSTNHSSCPRRALTLSYALDRVRSVVAQEARRVVDPAVHSGQEHSLNVCKTL
jgi:hypothetical protein